MAKIDWVFQDEMGTNLNRYIATNVSTGEAVTFDLNRGGSITIQGTPLNAGKMNSLISAINLAYDELSRRLTTSGGKITGDLQVDGELKVEKVFSKDNNSYNFLAFETNGIFYDKVGSFAYSENNSYELAIKRDLGETITIYEGNTAIEYSQEKINEVQTTQMTLSTKLGYSEYETLKVYIKGGTEAYIGQDFVIEIPLSRKLISSTYYVGGNGVNFSNLNQFVIIGAEVSGNASTKEYYGANCVLTITTYNVNEYSSEYVPIEAKKMSITKIELIRKYENIGR